MGNKVCVHCGVPRDYYADEKHWTRPSCRVSPSGHHNFAFKIFRCCCCASMGVDDVDFMHRDARSRNRDAPLALGMLR